MTLHIWLTDEPGDGEADATNEVPGVEGPPSSIA